VVVALAAPDQMFETVTYSPGQRLLSQATVSCHPNGGTDTRKFRFRPESTRLPLAPAQSAHHPATVMHSSARCRTARVPVGARFGKLLRVPDGKTTFLFPECDERGVRREEDQVFGFGHAQQQAVERITVRLRGFHAGQDVFIGYREDGCSC